MQHTVGPWIVDFSCRPYAIRPRGNDDSITRVGVPLGHVFRAHVRGHAGEQEANARLIAAAPEILGALLEIEELSRESEVVRIAARALRPLRGV